MKTVIPQTALIVKLDKRLRRLAQHKSHPSLPVQPNGEWDWDDQKANINKAAKLAMASPRVTTLAEPKHTHQRYEPCRNALWKVRKASLSHVASEPTEKLAKPKGHHAAQEDYNPKAFCVSQATLLVQASPRLSELATPPARKVRAKNV